jgi:hypothetical protein
MYTVALEGTTRFFSNTALKNVPTPSLSAAFDAVSLIAADPRKAMEGEIPRRIKKFTSISLYFSDKGQAVKDGVPEDKIEQLPTPYTLGSSYKYTAHTFAQPAIENTPQAEVA